MFRRRYPYNMGKNQKKLLTLYEDKKATAI